MWLSHYLSYWILTLNICVRSQNLSAIKADLINRLYEVSSFCTSAERIRLILDEILDPIADRFSIVDQSQKDSIVIHSETFKKIASVAVRDKPTLAANSITGPFATQSTSDVKYASPSATPFKLTTTGDSTSTTTATKTISNKPTKSCCTRESYAKYRMITATACSRLGCDTLCRIRYGWQFQESQCEPDQPSSQLKCVCSYCDFTDIKNSSCPKNWNLAGSNCYFNSQQKLAWANGEKFCREISLSVEPECLVGKRVAHLPSFHSQNDWDSFSLFRQAQNIGSFWVGLKRSELTAKWQQFSDGSLVNFNVSMDNDGAPLYGTGVADCIRSEPSRQYGWFDEGCDAQLQIVCQMPVSFN